MPEVPDRPLRFAAALAVVLPLVSAASPASAEATFSQCSNEWSESDAYDQCWDVTITPSDDNCTIQARCQTTAGGEEKTAITVDPQSVSGLNNCDGELTDGSCQ